MQKELIRFIHKPLQERGAQPGQWKPCTPTSAAVVLLSFRLGVRPSSRVLRVGTPPRAGAESAPTGGSAPPPARNARNAGRLASSPTGAGMGERGREREGRERGRGARRWVGPPTGRAPCPTRLIPFVVVLFGTPPRVVDLNGAHWGITTRAISFFPGGLPIFCEFVAGAETRRPRYIHRRLGCRSIGPIPFVVIFTIPLSGWLA